MKPPTHQPDQAPDAQEAEEIADLVAKTPDTLPLKRPATPVFVPATLPDEPLQVPENLAALENPPLERPISAPQAEETSSEASPVAEVVPEPVSLPTVVFSPPPDQPFRASLTLELRCALPDASIRYALNAPDVGEDGPLYDGGAKILLTQSSDIAARAWVNGRSGPLTLGHFEISQPQWEKKEPLDQSDATPHEISDERALEGPWKLAAASVRGKLHAHRGGWREDAFAHDLAHAADGTYAIVVVSDGAGSAPLSRVGSNLLCRETLAHLRDALTQSAPLSTDAQQLRERDLPLLRAVLVEAARHALQKLNEEAAKRALPLSDFASTLLILVRREWNGQQLCAALQAGDGAIALWNDDNTLTLLGVADHGEHSSETRFLTTAGMEAELPSRVRFSIRPNLRAVAAMTDGVADDYFPEATRLNQLFEAVLPLVKNGDAPGAALLQWIQYEKKGSSDDRGLTICWRADAASQPETVIEETRDGNA
ncbi:MAG: protein phosphatase 2C domain-containing protein [Armatimonadetes bacterium]|nr:protein phosphatase 2C domain-containing protein [Armatimonadota bacterium]